MIVAVCIIAGLVGLGLLGVVGYFIVGYIVEEVREQDAARMAAINEAIRMYKLRQKFLAR